MPVRMVYTLTSCYAKSTQCPGVYICVHCIYRLCMDRCAAPSKRQLLLFRPCIFQYGRTWTKSDDSTIFCHLSQEPTGALMASLQALRLPKAVGIGLAVLLRFFPTIGGEYHAIRNSQRFRGIGVGVFHTLTHLPSTVEYILIPLILRTTKVAEELSASMTVRGVRFSGETISYRPVRFAWRDAALCVVALLIPVIVFLLERRGIF